MGEAASSTLIQHSLNFFHIHTHNRNATELNQNMIEVTLNFIQCMFMGSSPYLACLNWIPSIISSHFTLFFNSEQFKTIVKQSLVSMVESVLICSGVSTVTVLGLDTLETFVKSQVCISMTNLLPSSHSQYLTMHSWHGAQWNKACDPSFTCQHNKVFIWSSKPDLCCRWLPPTSISVV